MRLFYYPALCVLVLGIVGCQSTPSNLEQQVNKLPAQKGQDKPTVKEQAQVKVTPYPESGIVQQSQPLPTVYQPSVTAQPPRVILPEPTHQANHRNLKDGRGIAAYSKLMQDYMQSLKQNNLGAAENYLIQAQRMAPQSAEVYRELARLSNLKQQGASAEAFARKGLTFAQNNVQRKQLWQQILQSAQLRNNVILMQQAQQNISKY